MTLLEKIHTVASTAAALTYVYIEIKKRLDQKKPDPVTVTRHALRQWSVGQTVLFFFSGIVFIYSLWFCAMNVTYLIYFNDFGPPLPADAENRQTAIRWVLIFGVFTLWSLVMFIRILRQPKRGSVIA